jgi:hypothetical protein
VQVEARQLVSALTKRIVRVHTWRCPASNRNSQWSNTVRTRACSKAAAAVVLKNTL